jgi:hypothetical protein
MANFKTPYDSVWALASWLTLKEINGGFKKGLNYFVKGTKPQCSKGNKI